MAFAVYKMNITFDTAPHQLLPGLSVLDDVTDLHPVVQTTALELPLDHLLLFSFHITSSILFFQLHIY